MFRFRTVSIALATIIATASGVNAQQPTRTAKSMSNCEQVASPQVADGTYVKATVVVEKFAGAALTNPVNLQLRGVEGLDRIDPATPPMVKVVKKCPGGSVVLSNLNTDGFVIADGIRFVNVAAP